MRSWFLLFSAALMACASRSMVDADAAIDASPPPITRVLTFSPSGTQQLQPGAQITVAVLLTDLAGHPVTDQDVRFALVGDTHDATLSDTHDTTGTSGDQAGVAHTTLLAPSVAATLAIRASADGAADARLDVAVSDRGFGGMAITARYGGARSPDSVVVDLFEEADCQSLASLDPVRSVTFSSGAGGAATVQGLPVGLSFAARGMALGPMNTVLAQACVDGITIQSDRTVNTFLPFVDVPLRAGGSYVLTADLDLGPTPTLAAAHWIQAVTDFATAHGSDVAYLLSTVGDAVHTHAPADYASFESAVPHLTTTVQTDLAMRGALPVQVLSQFAADTAMVVQSPTLTLAVDVAAPSGAMTNVTTLAVRSASLSLDPLTPDVHVDDATLSLASSGTGTIAVSGGDRASVSLRGLSMPFPTVARAAADALLARLGVSTTRDWVRAEVSCSHVAGLLVSSTGACDSSCVITACQSALDTLAQQLDQSIARMGSTHVSVGFDSEGPIAGVPGGLRIASIGPAPLLGSFDDDPTAVVLGVLSMQSH